MLLLSSLSCLCRPDSQPILVYGLAQDKGFIWHLKWCPAGGWESPTCGTNVKCIQSELPTTVGKNWHVWFGVSYCSPNMINPLHPQAPLLPRLGLLAVATSNGVVTIYSLPHPDALNTNKKQDNCGKTVKTGLTLPCII